eukprot:8409032-Alexandrium_andersonii.AAC.1
MHWLESRLHGRVACGRGVLCRGPLALICSAAPAIPMHSTIPGAPSLGQPRRSGWYTTYPPARRTFGSLYAWH